VPTLFDLANIFFCEDDVQNNYMSNRIDEVRHLDVRANKNDFDVFVHETHDMHIAELLLYVALLYEIEMYLLQLHPLSKGRIFFDVLVLLHRV
jgi:hypothetical protein